MNDSSQQLKHELYALFQSTPAVFDFMEENAFDGAWLLDWENFANGWLSPKFVAVLGYEPHEMPYSPEIWQDLIHPDDWLESQRLFGLHIAGKTPKYEQLLRYRHKLGHTIFIRCIGMTFRNAEGNPIHVFGVHTNVSNMVDMYNRLNDSEERYKQVVETQSDFVLLSEPDTTIKFANRALCKALGLEMHQVVGQRWMDLANKDDIARIEREIAKMTPENNRFITENRDYRANGEIGWTQWINQGVFDAQGKLTGLQSIGRDITEVKLAQQKLQALNDELLKEKHRAEEALHFLQKTKDQMVQVEKMASLGLLTAGVAHEINNPVNFISAGTLGLEESLEDLLKICHLYEQLGDSRREEERVEVLHQIALAKAEGGDAKTLMNYTLLLLRSIKDGTKRVSDIVKSLRDFSRSDEAESQISSLHENIENALLIMKPIYRTRIAIEKNFDPAIGDIECYPGQLGQVFVNLIGNAIDAIDGNGTIAIETHLNGTMVEIAIQDSGKGMTDEVQKKIFDPFFTTKPVGKGTGLGLSIVYGIVEKHHGRISVQSEQGNGTRFTLILPVAMPNEKR